MVEITESALDLATLIAAVAGNDAGAVVTFQGVVRERSDDDRPVLGLSYEAYPAMALPEMRNICREAEAAFPGIRIALAHRVGELALGEASVAIAVAAPHRRSAFDACAYVIDELKKRVPIWKEERYVGGDVAWRENPAGENMPQRA
ncbi:MAG: molybdenum cofactor biosynthesis protein MoaE [Candidatus Eremiobacteraeota bacterium]|nr:molybdenum cofactor biosynthesis protein MoaE [Candidatus Eremiobacteraeota bacterium]